MPHGALRQKSIGCEIVGAGNQNYYYDNIATSASRKWGRINQPWLMWLFIIITCSDVAPTSEQPKVAHRTCRASRGERGRGSEDSAGRLRPCEDSRPCPQSRSVGTPPASFMGFRTRARRMVGTIPERAVPHAANWAGAVRFLLGVYALVKPRAPARIKERGDAHSKTE